MILLSSCNMQLVDVCNLSITRLKERSCIPTARHRREKHRSGQSPKLKSIEGTCFLECGRQDEQLKSGLLLMG